MALAHSARIHVEGNRCGCVARYGFVGVAIE